MKLYFLRMKSIIIALSTIAAVASVVVAGKVTGTFSPSKKELPIYSVKTEGSVALTFNCAWGNEDIDDILSSLNRYNCKATFFIVGDWAEKFPESVQKIVSQGHEVGTHSYNHKDYTKLSSEQIKDDIGKADAAVSAACGITPVLLRVPSGAYNSDVIKTCREAGKTCIQWSVDSIDYNNASAEDIYNRVAQNVTDGSIILMHTGTASTAVALPRILDTLSGTYTLKKVSELTDYTGYSIDNTGMLIPDSSVDK